MSRTVLYHVPPLGLIRTQLRQEAKELYDFLEENGEIERLKRLDHLGIVRRVSEGAHHPRWEYIMLIMHLIDLAKEHVKEAHLSSRPRVFGHEFSSGQELLKTWALLLHLGHIAWTFTAERAFLAEVKRSSKLRQNLLEILSDQEIRDYAHRLLREEDIYRFYHIIAFLRLSQIAQDSHRQLWADTLKAYCVRDDAVARLVGIYQRLRQIAFFVLDSHYTPAIVSLDFAEILTDPQRLSIVLDPPGSSSVSLLTAIETHLYENVYLSEEVMRCAAALIPTLRKRIRRNIKNSCLDLVKSLADGSLQQEADGTNSPWSHIVNIPFRAVDPFIDFLLPIARPLREESEWCRDLPKSFRSSISVSVWPFPDYRQETVNVFVDPNASSRVIDAALATILKRLAKLYDDDSKKLRRWAEPDLLQDGLYSRIAASLMRGVLRQFFHKVGRWEFRASAGNPRHMAVFVSKRRDARRFLTAEIRALSQQGAARARKNELRGLRAALASERGRCFIIALTNLLAFDESGQNVGEIDGLAIVLGYNRIRLVIVEVTEQKKQSESKINRQLAKMLKTFALRPERKQKLTFHRHSTQHPAFAQLVLEFKH